ncbi:U1 small nuclear ribonucleoprotein 70 kDa [Branchiostoma belcheri]|nr:U1 small nuclear ribonucleoprotein 70 kDa [Branchiostoma belcheri]
MWSCAAAHLLRELHARIDAPQVTFPPRRANDGDPTIKTLVSRQGRREGKADLPGMTQYLPPNLLALFAPREPIPYLPPTDKLPCEKIRRAPYAGVTPFLQTFEDPKDTPPPTRAETRQERLERKRKEKLEAHANRLEEKVSEWDPANDPNASGDAYKTLFVARINYDTSESKLRREFEVYGPIRSPGKSGKYPHPDLPVDYRTSRPISLPRSLRTTYQRSQPPPYFEQAHAGSMLQFTPLLQVITGNTGNMLQVKHVLNLTPRFLPAQKELTAAYKHADGKKIDGRRVLVDVERGRTVKGWRPRRLGSGMGEVSWANLVHKLGGGLGGTRKGGPEVNVKHSGREDPTRGMGGGEDRFGTASGVAARGSAAGNAGRDRSGRRDGAAGKGAETGGNDAAAGIANEASVERPPQEEEREQGEYGEVEIKQEPEEPEQVEGIPEDIAFYPPPPPPAEPEPEDGETMDY